MADRYSSRCHISRSLEAWHNRGKAMSCYSEWECVRVPLHPAAAEAMSGISGVNAVQEGQEA
eukprot:2209599-Amphidinium_carterae.1